MFRKKKTVENPSDDKKTTTDDEASTTDDGDPILVAALTEFYRKHNPSQISTVSKICAQFKGREAALCKALENKYGEPVVGELEHVGVYKPLEMTPEEIAKKKEKEEIEEGKAEEERQQREKKSEEEKKATEALKAADDEFRKGSGQTTDKKLKPLPDGWETYFDSFGQEYYHNTLTDETTYDHPTQVLTVTPNLPLIEGWEAYHDDDGKEYYHNIKSGETSYKHPGSPNPITGLTNSLSSIFGGDQSEQSASSVNEADPPAPLKEGWEEYSDDEGDTYYHHLESGVSTYDRPVISDDDISEGSEDEAHSAKNIDLPGSWEAYSDDEGDIYYHNVETGHSTYDHPGKLHEDEEDMLQEAEDLLFEHAAREPDSENFRFYVVKFKDTLTKSTPYWTCTSSDSKVVSMLSIGRKLHGEVNSQTIVRGAPYATDSGFLNLGTGLVPTGPLKAGEQQEPRMLKLLPMVYLEPIQPDNLIGCTVRLNSSTGGDESRRDATVEKNDPDKNIITFAFLCDDTISSVGARTRNGGMEAIFRILEAPQRRFRIVQPNNDDKIDDRTYKNPLPWLSEEETGKGQVPYFMLRDEADPASMVEVGPNGNFCRAHGSVDVGFIVRGAKVYLGGKYYLDCGSGVVPTGLTNMGEQQIRKRKFLPFNCLVEIESPLVLVRSHVRIRSAHQEYSDLKVTEFNETNQTLRVEAKEDTSAILEEVSLNDVTQITWVAPGSKLSLREVVYKQTDGLGDVDYEEYTVTFVEEAVKLGFATHESGYPVVMANESGFDKPNLRDAVVAVNNEALIQSRNPCKDLNRRIEKAGRPITISFIHTGHNEFARGDFDEEDMYVLWFKEDSLNIDFKRHRHGYPIVLKNSTSHEKPIVDDVVLAVNGNMLYKSNEPYDEMMHLLTAAGRPVRLTFLTRDALKGKGRMSRKSRLLKQEAEDARHKELANEVERIRNELQNQRESAAVLERQKQEDAKAKELELERIKKEHYEMQKTELERIEKEQSEMQKTALQRLKTEYSEAQKAKDVEVEKIKQELMDAMTSKHEESKEEIERLKKELEDAKNSSQTYREDFQDGTGDYRAHDNDYRAMKVWFDNAVRGGKDAETNLLHAEQALTYKDIVHWIADGDVTEADVLRVWKHLDPYDDGLDLDGFIAFLDRLMGTIGEENSPEAESRSDKVPGDGLMQGLGAFTKALDLTWLSQVTPGSVAVDGLQDMGQSNEAESEDENDIALHIDKAIERELGESKEIPQITDFVNPLSSFFGEVAQVDSNIKEKVKDISEEEIKVDIEQKREEDKAERVKEMLAMQEEIKNARAAVRAAEMEAAKAAADVQAAADYHEQTKNAQFETEEVSDNFSEQEKTLKRMGFECDDALIQKLLAEHQGKIPRVVHALHDQGIWGKDELAPPPPYEPADGHESEYLHRLKIFYREKAPEKLEDTYAIGAALEAFKDHEEDLFDKLVAKYGQSSFEGHAGFVKKLFKRLWKAIGKQDISSGYVDILLEETRDEGKNINQGKLQAVIAAVESGKHLEMLQNIYGEKGLEKKLAHAERDTAEFEAEMNELNEAITDAHISTEEANQLLDYISDEVGHIDHTKLVAVTLAVRAGQAPDLLHKFGLRNPVSTTKDTTKDVARKRLTAFYSKHNPEKLDDLEETLTRYEGRYDKLFKKLQRKYDTEGVRQRDYDFAVLTNEVPPPPPAGIQKKNPLPPPPPQLPAGGSMESIQIAGKAKVAIPPPPPIGGRVAEAKKNTGKSRIVVPPPPPLPAGGIPSKAMPPPPPLARDEVPLSSTNQSDRPKPPAPNKKKRIPGELAKKRYSERRKTIMQKQKQAQDSIAGNTLQK